MNLVYMYDVASGIRRNIVENILFDQSSWVLGSTRLRRQSTQLTLSTQLVGSIDLANKRLTFATLAKIAHDCCI